MTAGGTQWIGCGARNGKGDARRNEAKAAWPAGTTVKATWPAANASQRSEPKRAGGSNSVVESQPSKLLVAGSIPVSRSNPVASLQSPVVLTAAWD
jgi:hypothetical protein